MKISIITATHYRSQIFADRVLKSILALQDRAQFEWIVINHGPCIATKKLVEATRSNFPNLKIIYEELVFDGFGQGIAKNMALQLAHYPLVAYIDDDNMLQRNFVAEMCNLFSTNKNLRFAVPIQQRRRDVLQNGKRLKKGTNFFSPQSSDTAKDLLVPDQIASIFDSNGFTHIKEHAPQWSESYRIYIDYIYLLDAISVWGMDAFQVYPKVLIDYVQTNEGVIGSSTFAMWYEELVRIWDTPKYQALFKKVGIDEKFLSAMGKYKKRAQASQTPKAFAA